MSTASDDIDEDELLQMALKEQAQRDLNYKKPSSNHRKPVVNYVQPPAQPKPSAAAPAKKSSSTAAISNMMRKGNQRVVEDDDDSEVEMLSISSEDEDSSKDQRLNTRARKGREDDRHWYGEEPDSWKRVDEAELARRVRDMRETRAAPVAQKFERKPSMVTRPGLNNLTSIPRGMECVDPLGLGVIDNKTLMLITETSDGSLSKHDKDYPDASLREKVNYFSEKFEAKLFLSRIHQDTKAAELEAGALALKNDLKGRTQQRKQLVKDNFDCFVSCKTTIDDIESKLRRIEEDPEGSGTSHLLSCIQGVSSVAARAFEPLFERQAQAEKIRSVQGMLQRFRTLFNLPSTIRGSIIKGEYDLAVREYKKAKSIALPSHVSILKRVLEEVEKVMNQFKGTLYKSLEDAQIDLTNLENIVRLLLELEPESDPIWHYLSIQNQRIRGLLERCTLDHEVRMEALQSEMHERVESDARWSHVQESDVNYLDGDSQPVNLNGEGTNALKGRYIRRLTAVIIHHIPDFWKKSLSIFNGKFAKVSSDSNVKSPSSRTGDRAGEGRLSSHSLDEVSGMIRDTLSLYEAKVLDTFKDLEDSNIIQSYMNDAMKEIAKALQAFDVKDAVPPIAVVAIRDLQTEATKSYIGKLCSWMRASISEISKDESWVPVSILERNRSPYMISYLPLGFRSAVSTAMDQINLLIQSLRSEATASEDIFAQLQETQESIRLQFLNSFMDLAGNLERIGGDLAQNRMNKENLLSQNDSYVTHDSLTADPRSSLADAHQQLLMVLSNIGFCKDELSYDLYNKYKHIWLESRERNEEDTDIRDLVMSFSGLEEKILEQYTFAKANLMRRAATNYLLDSSIQWGAAPVVKGVRDAAVGLLHTLVAVHAEVFAGARPLLGKTLGILVEGLIDTLLGIFNENQTKEFRSLDANGFSQLMLELKYFETILKPYFTPDAQESLKSLQGMLLEKGTESRSEVVGNPGHHRRSTRGSEEADDRQEAMTVSPDDLIELARQYTSELLDAELERTRINTACFLESVPLVPEPTRAASTHSRESIDSPSRKYRLAQPVGSPSFSRQRLR